VIRRVARSHCNLRISTITHICTRIQNTLPLQGAADNFLIGDTNQLQPTALEAACVASGGKVALELRMHDGYDHSYYFISSFIDDHINYHADAFGV